ncbi:hypothetical protein AB0N87_42495 [Streptomyces sp. NPDC093228]|uniref:hypothetical protein n=1 Tax=Streptomyces sp. NPDC093228 TaxID=3155070 RepID=UPI0034468760
MANRDDQTAARALALASHVPADLVTFCDSIGDVTCADIGNGYFRAPALATKVSPWGPFCRLL